MNTLEITSHLTLADWRAYQAAWAARLQAHSRISRRSLLGVVIVAIALAIALVALAAHMRQSVPFAAVVIGACAAILGILLSMRRLRGAAQPDDDGVVLGLNRLRFDAEGMHLQKAHSDIVHRWPVLRDITLTTEHLFVWVDTVAALIVPLRDLPPEVSGIEAADFIRAMAAGTSQLPRSIAEAGEAHISTAESYAPRVEVRRSPALWHSIARFATLRTSEAGALQLSDRALVGWIAALVIALFALDRVTAGSGAEFYSYGFVVLGWYGMLTLLVAMLWARLSEPQITLRSALIIAITFAPIAIALAFAALLYLPESASLGALILIVLYATFYANAALRSLTARAQPRALFAGLLLLSLAAWFAQAQYLSPQFWYAEDSQSEDGSDEAQTYLAQRQQAEALMYSQSDLIDEAADAMTRPDDLESAAFFVGFAGMGEQHVFASEIELAEHVIAEKYETGSRSLRLVNDRRDLEAYPLANPTALRRALADVAAKMDLENDVLFLALSSHGSPNGELSVSNLGMPLNNLSARDLADALEGSGILWRVVIVSACYSGTFIEPLRNDHTIIITASAADRTSFGCSDDRDLTYFGEAFYRDALPDAPDLRTAFQRMKTLIAEREKQEDIEPSNPQAYFGNAIERHLKALQAD
ncbi:MAG: C13 family peptidase [Povalibacter sp.]